MVPCQATTVEPPHCFKPYHPWLSFQADRLRGVQSFFGPFYLSQAIPASRRSISSNHRIFFEQLHLLEPSHPPRVIPSCSSHTIFFEPSRLQQPPSGSRDIHLDPVVRRDMIPTKPCSTSRNLLIQRYTGFGLVVFVLCCKFCPCLHTTSQGSRPRLSSIILQPLRFSSIFENTTTFILCVAGHVLFHQSTPILPKCPTGLHPGWASATLKVRMS